MRRRIRSTSRAKRLRDKERDKKRLLTKSGRPSKFAKIRESERLAKAAEKRYENAMKKKNKPGHAKKRSKRKSSPVRAQKKRIIKNSPSLRAAINRLKASNARLKTENAELRTRKSPRKKCACKKRSLSTTKGKKRKSRRSRSSKSWIPSFLR